MKKAMLNYWVDAATGIAFLLCAVTGIVFLFPGAVHTAVGAMPSILLLPATWWHAVHDWSGVAMVAGTALHLVLHAKWIAVMTRRVAGGRAGRTRATAPAAQTSLPAARPAHPATVVAATGPAQADPNAQLQTLERHWERRRVEREQREHQRRHTRKVFLSGAAALSGAALLVSLGLVRSNAGGSPLSSATGSSTDQPGTTSQSSSNGPSTQSNGSGSASSGSSSGSSGSSTGVAAVSVDQSACVACGRCLQICPKGVFEWNGSNRAAATSPDACIRCGRCLQVGPASAITVSA